MRQATRDAARQIVAAGLEERREQARLEIIRQQLAAEEAAYRAEINRQMDAGYLFDRINRSSGKTAVKLYDADTGTVTEATQKDTEWWDEYPCLYSCGLGAGIILGLMVVSHLVLSALGMI